MKKRNDNRQHQIHIEPRLTSKIAGVNEFFSIKERIELDFCRILKVSVVLIILLHTSTGPLSKLRMRKTNLKFNNGICWKSILIENLIL